MIRTHDAGSLRADDAGQTVTLAGWVANRRDHGGVAFIDLREASGIAQVVVRDESVAHSLRSEYCIAVTGTVLEVFMAGYERLKSVAGGGRYDALASDGRTTYPGVGISFGVSRTLVPLITEGVLAGSRAVSSAVLVALADEDARPAAQVLANRLRRRGIPTEVAASPQKFGKQIRYAERRGIPFVWFPPSGAGGGHEVKDIRSGEQVEADLDSWMPPHADLRPQVTVEEELS